MADEALDRRATPRRRFLSLVRFLSLLSVDVIPTLTSAIQPIALSVSVDFRSSHRTSARPQEHA